MINGIKASLYREFKLRLSSSRVFVENIANPLFTLLIFGFALGNTVGYINNSNGKSIKYLNYFVIGAINISLVSNALVASTKMFLDKYLGMYEEMLSYPVKRSEILLGKLIFNLILSIIQAFIMMFFVQIITGYNNIGIIKFIFLFLLLIVGSSTWFYCLILLSIKLKTQDSFNTMYFLIMTPIIFTSSIYYPVEKLPLIFRWIGYINPLSWFTDIGRYIYLNIYTRFLMLKLFAIIILLISTFLFTNKLFDKGIDK
ncbi:ABC transporter permease [Clostridium felsineum]|uniref:ABC transporter permease n=1 Tax=Clostridium felsineum TaxID=36839 RepID=UPI00098CCB0D|nr:ABC transporter permease [Clostridium felsineum]URZ14079.1 Inner membrane transport permease YadH [Clostridium felsineum DSM 794]